MENKKKISEIIDSIRTRYKSLDSPNFVFVREVISEPPYRDVIKKIEEKFQVEEDTDPNDDVSFGYLLTKNL